MPLELPDPGLKLPPAELYARVGGDYDNAREGELQSLFLESGGRSADELQRGLAAIGRELTDFTRILDFGCGPGRMLRRLASVAGGREIWGVDVDRLIVDWTNEAIPFARVVLSPHEPPLAFADGYFDLVYNHSVLTHLPAGMQDVWLAELARVTADGGIVALTVHGPDEFERVAKFMRGAGEDVAPARAALETAGIFHIADDAYVGSSHGAYYHTTFHAPWYVLEHWTRWFRVRAYLPLGSNTQDLVVLEKPPAGASPAVLRARPVTAAAAPSAPVESPGKSPLDRAEAVVAELVAEPAGHGPRARVRAVMRRAARPVLAPYREALLNMLAALRAMESEAQRQRGDRGMTPTLAAIFEEQSQRIERLWQRVGVGEGSSPDRRDDEQGTGIH